MGKMVYLKDVVTLELDEQKCTGCGICLIVCPHAVFGIDSRHARINNRDACMECGACAQNCPAEAVMVQAGVGCATAVINAALGKDSPSCCSLDQPEKTSGIQRDIIDQTKQTGCC